MQRPIFVAITLLALWPHAPLAYPVPANLRGPHITNDNPFSRMWRDYHPPKTFVVTEFGAKGDGTTYDTGPIQNAIDACASSGGGVVKFPAGGKFLTGTIYLKTGVYMHIDAGAVVVGGTRRSDYPTEKKDWFVVLAENASDVGIVGPGTIDGQAQAFVADRHPAQFADKYWMVSWNEDKSICDSVQQCRPKLVGFRNCSHVTIQSVYLHEPAFWCLEIDGSHDVSISNIQIYGDEHIPNNDGIDIRGSQRVSVTDCTINTADDGICLKSPATKEALETRDISVRRCAIRSKSSAVKFGSESGHDFRNIFFWDLHIHDSNRGLGFQIVDGGNVENVVFSSVTLETRFFEASAWWGAGEPISIVNRPRNDKVKVGKIKGIQFENMHVVSENGIFISGSPGGEVEEISFQNVVMLMDKFGDGEGGRYDYRPAAKGIVESKNSLVCMEHARGVDFKEVWLEWGPNVQPFWGPGLRIVNKTVHDVRFSDAYFSGL